MTNTAQRTKILIAGIGNIFQGDDAFGSEVARRLLPLSWPDGVNVVDFGIRGIDLTYALLDGPQVAILIDATPQNGRPGTLYVIEPDAAPTDPESVAGVLLDAHSLNPVNVLRQVRAMGGRLPHVLLVGCEPADLGGEQGSMELSPPVQAAVDEAVELVQALVGEMLEAEFTEQSAHTDRSMS